MIEKLIRLLTKMKSEEFGMVDYSTHLSKNFTISEFEKSQTATRHGIDNKMPPGALADARKLAEHVLQRVRDKFGITVINSGYRSVRTNLKVGGSRKSQHMSGEAADIEVPGISNYDLAVWIRDNLDFDQLILEGYTPGIPDSGWVHVSYVSKDLNRKQTLTVSFNNGKASYVSGLVK